MKSYDTEKITNSDDNRSITSMDVGETKKFTKDSGRGKKFTIEFLFKDRLKLSDSQKSIQYKVEVTFTNGLNSIPISSLGIIAKDANEEVPNYYEDQKGEALYSGGIYNETYTFTAPKDAHVEFFGRVKYNRDLIDSNSIFLLSFEAPKIVNVDIQKNVYDPKTITINWVFEGPTISIITGESKISGTGVPGEFVGVDPLLNSVTISDLDYATEYNDWNMEIAYQSGFNEEAGIKFSKVNLPSFITFNEDMDLIPTFSYKTIEKGKLSITAEIKNITDTPFEYSNFTFFSPEASLVDSRNVTINEDGTYEFDNISLTQDIYNDFKVRITIRDKFGTYSYTKSLPPFTIEPTISNLEETINPDSGQILLQWEVNDDNELFNSFYLYDEKNSSVIMVLSSSAIATQSLSIIDMDGDLDCDWTIRGDWTSSNDSGTAVSNDVTFTTIWRHKVAPKIIFSNYSNLRFNSVDINWELYDGDNDISKVYLYDELNNNIIHTMTDKELLNQKVIINNLATETDYSWTLRIEWDDPNYDGETTVVGEVINFKTMREPYDVPVIDSFSYKDLDYNSVTICWTITDPNNALTQLYLYDLTNQTVLDKPLNKETGEIKLDNLVGGQEYNFELRGTWLDPIYSSGEIVSENSIAFVVPYTPKAIPTIDDFTYKDLTYDSVTLDWTITDADEALKNVYLYDTISESIIATNLDQKNGSFILRDLSQGQKYNLVLRGTWLDEHYSSGEIKSSNSIEFTVPFVPKELPTIDAFSYSDLSYDSVTINWAITDTDNALQAVYLYDLLNEKVFKSNLDDKGGSLIIDNLVQGETYKFELRGTWLDQHYSSGEIKSNNVLEFTVPYKHKVAPEIISFNVDKVTSTTTTVSWEISDVDKVITKVYLYDEINKKIIYEFSKAELLASQATIDNLGTKGTQKLTLKVDWNDFYYGEKTITSNVQEFKIPSEKNSIKLLYIGIGIIILIIIILIILLIIFLIYKKRKANKEKLT